ncbi:GTPase Era [Algiphilus sp.]|uniref:GTPase Era n=1 Tax=Algiphilus sp. TaxID=1872431 RepID=UPI0025BB00BC|nr:GTPase Era [Algiphilus sp.]MCK5769769.1 GTPase Era [Algiphilus sp.]
MRSGMVAVLGRPNVGKSSLVNALVGTKVSIVARRPQTTRHRVQGVHNGPELQIVFIDTPGLHEREHRALNKVLNRSAVSAIEGVDAVLHVVETGIWRDDDALALSRAAGAGVPVIAALNKVDHRAQKQELLPEIAALQERHAYADIVPVSATRGENLDRLIAVLAERMPEGPMLFPPDQIQGHDLAFTITECVREKLTRLLRQELPYALSVGIESLEDSPGLLRARAVIWVEREAQKKIVIGAGGDTAKRVGTSARRELEHRLGKKVFLQTHVRVRPNWSDDPAALRALGYED